MNQVKQSVLSSIYSGDIKNGDMKLKWNRDWLKPYKRTIISGENSEYISPSANGNINEQRWDVNLDIGGKK